MNKNRRKFLSGLCVLASSSLLDAKIESNEFKWDEEWDVLVVGSGFAGSAAACQSIDDGAKTLLIDKMPVLGGKFCNKWWGICSSKF